MPRYVVCGTLEPFESPRLLWCVPAPPQRPVSASPSVVVGAVAAAATTGALLAIGHRLGSIGIPFAEVSAALFRRTASGGEAGLVFTGLALHVVFMMLWSAAYVWLVARARWRPVVAATVVAIGTQALSWLVAWSTGRGIATVVPLGDRIVLAIVLAIALVIGIRLAFLPREMPD